MAIDNTPPRLRLIITIAVITVITLIGVDFVLKGYYAYMADEARRGKLAPTTAKTEQAAAVEAAFKAGALPIDQSMAQLSRGARAELIAPQQSEDLGPMTGWSQLPKTAPTQEHVVPASPDAGATEMATGDAGAAMHAPAAADAGAPKLKAPAAGDAGAKKPAPAPKAPKKDGGPAAPKGAPNP